MGRILDKSFNFPGEIRGNVIFNKSYDKVGEARGNEIFNKGGTRVGKADEESEAKFGGALLLLLM